MMIFAVILSLVPQYHSFIYPITLNSSGRRSFLATTISATTKNLSSLPRGISPFESKSDTLPQEFRSIATRAWNAAFKAGGGKCWEIEFPPLLFQGKSQFDDFDNISELNLNRDWCVEWLPTLSSTSSSTWLVLPDAKECEIAKNEWQGQRYRDAAKFTTIEDVTKFYDGDGGYTKPWGATLSDGMKNLLQSDADPASDDLTTETAPSLHLVWYVF